MKHDVYFDIISGRQTGLFARAARSVLWCGSLLYAAVVRLRNGLFDRGLRHTFRPPVPVISVGNLTTGGTGKTPFVAFLTDWFRRRGVHVVLISRGYRSHTDGANDEKLVLDCLCPGIVHLQNSNRVRSAVRAFAEHQSELLLVDDGFQHRRLGRDLDIVLVDATNPFGYGYPLPRGLMREPVTGLRRAQVVALTRVDQVERETVTRLRERIARLAPEADLLEVSFPPQGLVRRPGEREHPLDLLAGQRVAAVCGIGNPAGFRRTLQSAGFDVPENLFFTFPDHHHFSKDEIRSVNDAVRRSDGRAVLTTLKDLVKIAGILPPDPPWWALTIGTEVHAGAGEFEALLETLRKRAKRN